MKKQPQTKGYQWPADRITANEMETLSAWREKYGIPINEALRQAIEVLSKYERGALCQKDMR